MTFSACVPTWWSLSPRFCQDQTTLLVVHPGDGIRYQVHFPITAGLGRKEVADSAFWDIFKLKSSAALPEAIQETARLNKEFTISGVCLASWHHSDTSDDSAAAGRLFSMGFRWAAALPPF